MPSHQIARGSQKMKTILHEISLFSFSGSCDIYGTRNTYYMYNVQNNSAFACLLHLTHVFIVSKPESTLNPWITFESNNTTTFFCMWSRLSDTEFVRCSGSGIQIIIIIDAHIGQRLECLFFFLFFGPLRKCCCHSMHISTHKLIKYVSKLNEAEHVLNANVLISCVHMFKTLNVFFFSIM